MMEPARILLELLGRTARRRLVAAPAAIARMKSVLRMFLVVIVCERALR